MSNETKQLKITLTRSVISSQKRQKATVAALGLRKLHQSVIQKDNPNIRGMIAKVSHLLTVEEYVSEASPKGAAESEA